MAHLLNILVISGSAAVGAAAFTRRHLQPCYYKTMLYGATSGGRRDTYSLQLPKKSTPKLH